MKGFVFFLLSVDEAICAFGAHLPRSRWGQTPSAGRGNRERPRVANKQTKKRKRLIACVYFVAEDHGASVEEFRLDARRAAGPMAPRIRHRIGLLCLLAIDNRERGRLHPRRFGPELRRSLQDAARPSALGLFDDSWQTPAK